MSPTMRPLAITGATLDGVTIGLRARDGLIAELGPDVAAEPGDEVIDAAGTAIVPGFVNAHTHAAMTLFRGYADDLPLMEWLEDHIWPAEARLEAEDVYWGTRLACVEMIRTGTVRFWDMYWHPAETAKAAIDAGLRAVVGAPLIAPDGSAADAERVVAASLEQMASVLGSPLVAAAIAPHALYTVAPAALAHAAELSAEHGLPLQIHLSETEDEVRDCLSAHGARPARHLEQLGVLGERTVLAHGVWLDEDELDLVAASGATLVTNPVANMKLGVGGVFPYLAARARGARVGIGTDGAGSNNSLDVLADAKAFALVQKHAAASAAAVDAAEVLAIARGERAPLLAAGRLEVGAAADFLLVRTDDPALVPGKLDAGLVYAGSGRVVDTTVVAGRCLMRGGVIEDESEVVARARERFQRLLG